MELEGRIAAVTGGTRGIGLAIVEAYLREGASVCINGRSAERGAEIAAQLGQPDRVHFMAGDVMDRTDVEAFVDGTVERFGRIDVLVNNAGGADHHAPVAELTDEALELALKWNVWSTFWACDARCTTCSLKASAGSSTCRPSRASTASPGSRPT